MIKILLPTTAIVFVYLTSPAFSEEISQSSDIFLRTELYQGSGHCKAPAEEVPVWKWDRESHQFLLAGYECRVLHH